MIIALLASMILLEKPKPYAILFILLGMVGMAFIIRPFGAGFDPDILYPLLSVTLFGLYIVLARRLSRRLGSLFVTSAAILSGVAVLGIYATFSGVRLFAGLTARDMGYLAYLGVIVSGLAYVSYFKGMDLTSTNTGSVVFFLKAMTAAVLSSLLLGEKLELPVIIGALFIAAGIAVMVAGGISDKRRGN
jgi:drug/metabolite transporter (DMT)-like permease